MHDLAKLKGLDAWPAMRKDIEAALHKLLGPMADIPADMQVKVVDEIEGPGYTRKQVHYFVDDWSRISAWVFVPEDALDCPALICCHSRTKMAKDEPAGYEGADPALAFGRYFAEMGYVTIAPDCITAGERVYSRLDPYDTSTYYKEKPKQSALGKMVSDYRCCSKVLEEISGVDPDRIGAIGHGLGGCCSLLLGAVDERVAAVVASCGFTRFENDHQPDRWLEHDGLSLLPGLANAIAENTYPVDWEHILALAAPSPTLLITADNHSMLSEPSSCQKAVDMAKPVFKMLGAPKAIENHVHPGEETLPQDELDAATEWFDRWL